MSEKLLYAAAALAWTHTIAAVFSTFSKTMIRLRFASIIANVCGLIVGAATFNVAGLLRHLIVLPIDVIRLREMRRLVARVKNASPTTLDVEWLKPFMHTRRFKAGETLFAKGDLANEAFILVDGEIALPEAGALLDPGALFGEMALFTPDRTRTASAVCRSDARLLCITYEQFEQLYFQNPEFGLYLVRLIVGRFVSRIEQLDSVKSVA